MQRVYTSSDPALCGWLASLLEAAGIACQLRNNYLGGAVGELPVNECWPELWVLDDADRDRSERLINEALRAAEQPAPDWHCQQCGEKIDGVFAQCWRCGALAAPGN